MSPAPSSGSVGDDLYQALEPLTVLDDSNGYALAHLCAAIGVMFQDVDDLIRDQDDRPGWANLLDIDSAPTVVLPYLAAIAGVRPTAAASAEQQRQQIKVVDGQRRGRPAAIIEAVQATLTGTKTVTLVENAGGNAYALTVITRPSETPSSDATSIAVTNAVPAGLYPVTHVETDDPIWDETALTWDAVGGAVTWDTVTVSDV